MKPGSLRSFWISAVFWLVLSVAFQIAAWVARSTGDPEPVWLSTPACWIGAVLFLVAGVVYRQWPEAVQGKRSPRGRAAAAFWSAHVGTSLFALSAGHLPALWGALSLRLQAWGELAGLRPGDPGHLAGTLGTSGAMLWFAVLGLLVLGIAAPGAGVPPPQPEPAPEPEPEPAPADDDPPAEPATAPRE